jgi:kinesin family protein C1
LFLIQGALLEETKHINKSLSTLSNVIERLQAGDKNVPFRESKLTFLLKDSLSGNSKTLAIVCCNPLPTHVNESLSSLRFAAKVNRVDLKAVANFSC